MSTIFNNQPSLEEYKKSGCNIARIAIVKSSFIHRSTNPKEITLYILDKDEYETLNEAIKLWPNAILHDQTDETKTYK